MMCFRLRIQILYLAKVDLDLMRPPNRLDRKVALVRNLAILASMAAIALRSLKSADPFGNGQ